MNELSCTKYSCEASTQILRQNIISTSNISTSSLPDLETTLFLLCPHTVSPPCEHRKRGSFGVSSFSNKDISLSDWGPDHMTPFNLNYLPKVPISKYSHMEI